MIMWTIAIFGLATGVLFDVLVGLVGSRRNIGFGWAFILSVLFTPLVGLIVVLISDPLPAGAEPKYGCLGRTFGCLGAALLVFIVAAMMLAAISLLLPIA